MNFAIASISKHADSDAYGHTHQDPHADYCANCYSDSDLEYIPEGCQVRDLTGVKSQAQLALVQFSTSTGKALAGLQKRAHPSLTQAAKLLCLSTNASARMQVLQDQRGAALAMLQDSVLFCPNVPTCTLQDQVKVITQYLNAGRPYTRRLTR